MSDEDNILLARRRDYLCTLIEQNYPGAAREDFSDLPPPVVLTAGMEVLRLTVAPDALISLLDRLVTRYLVASYNLMAALGPDDPLPTAADCDAVEQVVTQADVDAFVQATKVPGSDAAQFLEAYMAAQFWPWFLYILAHLPEKVSGALEELIVESLAANQLAQFGRTDRPPSREYERVQQRGYYGIKQRVEAYVAVAPADRPPRGRQSKVPPEVFEQAMADLLVQGNLSASALAARMNISPATAYRKARESVGGLSKIKAQPVENSDQNAAAE